MVTVEIVINANIYYYYFIYWIRN